MPSLEECGIGKYHECCVQDAIVEQLGGVPNHEDCKLNTVETINLDAVSSDANIVNMAKGGRLSGSFGNLFIKNIASGFGQLDIRLENTDATLKLPNSAFVLDYDGKRSRVVYPESLKVNKTSRGDRTLIEGYNGSSSASSKLSITAMYSKVSMQ